MLYDFDLLCGVPSQEALQMAIGTNRKGLCLSVFCLARRHSKCKGYTVMDSFSHGLFVLRCYDALNLVDGKDQSCSVARPVFVHFKHV